MVFDLNSITWTHMTLTITPRHRWALSFSSPGDRKWVSVRKYSMCDRGRIILYKYFLATTSLCSGGSTSENVPQKAIEEKKGIRYWFVETNV